MKAPLSWLREYVRIDLDVDELASRLALTGTEVERVSEVGVPGGAENLSQLRGRQGARLRAPSRRRQAVGVHGGRGRGRAADHRVRRAQRGGRPDGGRGPAGRRHARRHAHQGSQAARRAVGRG